MSGILKMLDLLHPRVAVHTKLLKPFREHRNSVRMGKLEGFAPILQRGFSLPFAEKEKPSEIIKRGRGWYVQDMICDVVLAVISKAPRKSPLPFPINVAVASGMRVVLVTGSGAD